MSLEVNREICSVQRDERKMNKVLKNSCVVAMICDISDGISLWHMDCHLVQRRTEVFGIHYWIYLHAPPSSAVETVVSLALVLWWIRDTGQMYVDCYFSTLMNTEIVIDPVKEYWREKERSKTVIYMHLRLHGIWGWILVLVWRFKYPRMSSQRQGVVKAVFFVAAL